MEFIERLPLDKLHYLNTLSFKQYKPYDKSSSKNEDERKDNYNKMKTLCDNFIKANGTIKRLYKFTGANNWNENGDGNGRLFAVGCGVQGLPKKLRGFLLNGITTDIDMVNAHPVILRYLCRTHNLPYEHLNFYIEHRDEVLSQFADRDTGKTLFLKATNDDKINKKETNELFKAYDKEMKTTQKLLTQLTCYKNIVSNVSSNKLYNWYGSAINRILCFYENKILQIIISELNKQNYEICSPMFDGVMIYGVPSETLLQDLEQKINSEFIGLDMKLSFKEHSNDIIMPEDFKIPESKTQIQDAEIKMVNNDNDACKLIFDELKHCFKSYKGRLFYLHENIWIYDDNFIDNFILTYILNSKIYFYTKENQDGEHTYTPYCQNITTAKHVREALYSQIRINNNDDELYNKFHTTTKGKLCFNDGVLDFVNKSFMTWEQVKEQKIEIYTTTKINRNYRTYFETPNFEVINEIKEKIFNTLYGDNTNKSLLFLARALAGHHEDKRWATYLGNRNCGKGVEYDLLSEGFESYVSTFELGNILYCRKTAGTENVDCSKKLYWLIDLEFVRLSVSQEIPDCNSGLQVNSKQLKKITGGGDTIIARRNYDRRDTHFKIDTSFYIKGNNTLICDNVDCDETRVEFCSVVQFKTEEEIEIMKQEGRDEKEMIRYKVSDKDIKNKCKSTEWKNAIVYLIFQNYSDKCVEIKKSFDIEDNTLLGSIHEKYELTYNKDDCILCNDVHSEMNSFDKGKIALELNAMNIFKKKNRTKELKNKWCYFGIKLKQEEKQDT
jgi:hypothetical protein